MKAKCDWLSLTYSPEDSVLEDVKAELLQAGATLEPYSTDKKMTLRVPSFGTVHLDARPGFHSVNFSGTILEYLRITGRYHSMLSLLSNCPHKVTRLDAAYDVNVDAADVLAALIAASPSGTATLTRKAMPLKEFMGVRSDGRRSGTLYYGYKTKARVTARVYDKTQEALEKRNELLPPTTRYEITIRDGIATLNDAFDPTAIFWHYAVPVLLPPPAAAPPQWVPCGDMLGWNYDKPEVLPMDVLKRHISNNMPTLVELADSVGPYGRETALYVLAKHLGLELQAPPLRATRAGLGVSEDAESTTA
jgi:hypothetical protein